MWAVEDGAYVQSDAAAENTLVTAGDKGWHNYDLNVKATKKSGKEGFLVAFGVKDTGNYYWWNLGGWNNTQSAVEKTVDGAKQTHDPGRHDHRDGPQPTTCASRCAADR